MAEYANIEWTDHTFNPWWGCNAVSHACSNCYAAALDKRTGGDHFGVNKPRRRTSTKNWLTPIKWNKKADAFFAEYGRRQRVFCASMADVFDNAVPVQWRIDLMRLILDTPNLDWLLLTKRIGNAAEMLDVAFRAVHQQREKWADNVPPNVWIGATICNQKEADRDIPKLLLVPAEKRFLSIEPLLGQVDLSGHVYTVAPGLGEGIDWLTGRTSQHSSNFGGDTTPWLSRDIYEFPQDAMEPRIHWVIVGGESGPNARPMHPDWVRSLRDQCQEAGAPFLFKQWGEFDLSYDRDRDDPDCKRCGVVDRLPGRWINLAGGHGFSAGERVHFAHKVGKKAAGRMLDGRTWDEVPA